MRKFTILSIVVLFSCEVMAQGERSAATNESRSSTSNGGAIPSNTLTKALATDLGLTPAQTPKFNKAVYDFLVEKKKANHQQTANKSEQVQSAFTHFDTELKGIISEDQLSKFRSLKPKANDPKNPYSILFY